MENVSVRQISKGKLLIAGTIALAVILSLWLWQRGERDGQKNAKTGAQTEHADEEKEGAQEVELSPEALVAAKLEYAEVTARDAVTLLRVTGSVTLTRSSARRHARRASASNCPTRANGSRWGCSSRSASGPLPPAARAWPAN